ncbi:MAG: discoidin domain-containing protein, partial [Actinomycetota bacterium]|nr:discoidin domain-containing protein [Actinomycetota bacterium]
RPVAATMALVAIGVVIALAALRGTDEDPGEPPRNSRPAGDRDAPPARQLSIAGVGDFDPYGDGQSEHPEEASLAIDGNRSTAWTTETYNDPLQLIKPGVGLVFDLGRDRDVQRIKVISGQPGYAFEVKTAGTLPGDVTGFTDVGTETSAPPAAKIDAGGARGRYWLVWITKLPGGDGGDASLAEVKFIG